jgi:uncharacterized protein (TIGR02271 family)
MHTLTFHSPPSPPRGPRVIPANTLAGKRGSFRGRPRGPSETYREIAKNGPAFDDDREITPEFENQVYSYYGLQQASGSTESGAYETYQPETTASDVRDEDELRVQRTEEELVAGTREREAGAMKVRKRVRTDREQIEVPTRREEVSVERVPVSGEATEAEIGEDEVVVPVTEEEVVVGKRAVAKEEVRIKKDVVEDTEVVEEDVRREEIDLEDALPAAAPKRLQQLRQYPSLGFSGGETGTR